MEVRVMVVLASPRPDPKERAKLANIATRFYLASVMLAKSHPDSSSPALISELTRIKIQAAADRDHLLVTCADSDNPPRLGSASCSVIKFAVLGIAQSLSVRSLESAHEVLARLYDHLGLGAPDAHVLAEFSKLLRRCEDMPRAA
jgi:hypothetical protein